MNVKYNSISRLRYLFHFMFSIGFALIALVFAILFMYDTDFNTLSVITFIGMVVLLIMTLRGLLLYSYPFFSNEAPDYILLKEDLIIVVKNEKKEIFHINEINSLSFYSDELKIDENIIEKEWFIYIEYKNGSIGKICVQFIKHKGKLIVNMIDKYGKKINKTFY